MPTQKSLERMALERVLSLCRDGEAKANARAAKQPFRVDRHEGEAHAFGLVAGYVEGALLSLDQENR